MNVRFENLILSSQRKNLRDYLVYAQMSIYDVNTFERYLALIIIGISIVAGFLSFRYLPIDVLRYKLILALIIAIGVWAVMPFVLISLLSFIADSVSQKIDRALPDMLLIMATNIRAGTIPEQAFISSIRPQFGPLNNLLRYAAVEIESGKTFTDALGDISNLTNSESFKESMRIISEGARSGAEIDKILESLSTSILKDENLREQMAAEIKSYEMFILGTSLLAAPLLYGISFIMITILTGLLSSVNTGHVNLNTNVGFLSNIN
ncbi:MAG: type II secretion system F family protein, partial [Conexivisphaerales archaeon]